MGINLFAILSTYLWIFFSKAQPDSLLSVNSQSTRQDVLTQTASEVKLVVVSHLWDADTPSEVN